MTRTFFVALLCSSALVSTGVRAQTQPEPAVGSRGQSQIIPISRIKSMEVYDGVGQRIATVARVVVGDQGQAAAVLNFNDTTQIDDARIVPFDRISVGQRRLTLTMDKSQLRNLETWQAGNARYRDVKEGDQLQIAGRQVGTDAQQQTQLQSRQPAGTAATRQQAGTDVVIQRTAPRVRINEGAPRVRVLQQPPRVAVEQRPPEIIVRQPRPTVTLNLPQPEVVVRMHRPEVAVAQQPPRVRVQQADPNVRILPPEQEPAVLVEPADPRVQIRGGEREPAVSMSRVEGAPQVRYESEGAPRVVVERQGELSVQYEVVAQGDRAAAPRQSARQGDRTHQEQAQQKTDPRQLAFNDFDRNSDGALNKEEFRVLTRQIKAEWDLNNDRQLDRAEFYGGVFGAWDRDNNNVLNQSEYNEAWAGWGRNIDRIAFTRFDRNGDDNISNNEFGEAWGRAGLYENWAGQDGRLTNAEFNDNLFGVWDADRSGAIEQEHFSIFRDYGWGVDRFTLARRELGVGQPEAAVVEAPQMRPFTVGQLLDSDVYNYRGNKLGELERIIRAPTNGQSYAVVEHGGFLGFWENEVALPLQRFSMVGDRVYVRGVTEQDLEAMDDFDEQLLTWRPLGEADTVELGVGEGTASVGTSRPE